MKVSGFTFWGNSTLLDDPCGDRRPSLRSVGDEVIVAVGTRQDDTPDHACAWILRDCDLRKTRFTHPQ